jgi:Cdc6-like AAA superfamily ATPase
MTFQIIPNRPNDTDAFSGAHCHIAVSLHNLILGNKDSVVVGLDGKRGSGKSTIVQIVRKSFENNDNVKIVSIDAWAHGGNHLRRACLETLADELQSENETNDRWIDKKWAKQFKKLDLKKATKKVKSVPLTRDAIFGALGAILFAFALTYLLKFLDLFLGNKSDFSDLAAPLFSGITFLIISLLIVFTVFRKKTIEEFLISLLKISTAPEALITIKSAPDQSSILFQKWFMEMLAPLSESPEKKLVIVFDNLDRLNMTEQKAAWQTLQTFLEARENFNFPQNITFIICFDLSAHPTQASQAEMNDRFEKILDTRFHVPMMPLGKWTDLAENALKERDFDEVSRKEIIDTLSILYAKDNSFTIRKLTQCANALRTLEAQNQIVRIEGEPPSYKLLICYWYELSRGDYIPKVEGETQIEKLTFVERLQSKRIDQKIKRVLDKKTEEIIADFAQLYCGLDRSEAMDFLLGEPIITALKEGNTQKIKQLSQDHPACGRIIRIELEDQFTSFMDLNVFRNIICALWDENASEQINSDYIQIIEKGIPFKENALTFTSDNLDSGVKIFINLLPLLEEEKKISFLKNLARAQISTSSTHPQINDEPWYLFAKGMIELLSESDRTYFRPLPTGSDEQIYKFMEKLYNLSRTDPIFPRQFIKQISDDFEYPNYRSDDSKEEWYFRIIRDDINDFTIKKYLTEHIANSYLMSEILTHYNQETKIGEALRENLKTHATSQAVRPNHPQTALLYFMEWFLFPHTRQEQNPNRNFSENYGFLHFCIPRIPDISDDDVINTLTDVATLNPNLHPKLLQWIKEYKAKMEKRTN